MNSKWWQQISILITESSPAFLTHLYQTPCISACLIEVAFAQIHNNAIFLPEFLMYRYLASIYLFQSSEQKTEVKSFWSMTGKQRLTLTLSTLVSVQNEKAYKNTTSRLKYCTFLLSMNSIIYTPNHGRKTFCIQICLFWNKWSFIEI